MKPATIEDSNPNLASNLVVLNDFEILRTLFSLEFLSVGTKGLEPLTSSV